MNDGFERIEVKLDKLSDRLASIDSTLAAQHVSLSEHMRRTLILEERMEPIKTHVAMVQGALKLIGVLALLGGFAEGVASVLELMKGR